MDGTGSFNIYLCDHGTPRSPRTTSPGSRNRIALRQRSRVQSIEGRGRGYTQVVTAARVLCICQQRFRLDSTGHLEPFCTSNKADSTGEDGRSLGVDMQLQASGVASAGMYMDVCVRASVYLYVRNTPSQYKVRRTGNIKMASYNVHAHCGVL